jgi:AraC-like DNA-binding protein
VRTATPVAAGPGFGISTVNCVDDHVGWSPAELSAGNTVVLVRRGRFRRSAGGALVDADSTVGYVGLSGGEERFAHPAGGDLCTAVTVSDPLWASFAGDRDPAPGLYVDAALDLAHRRLLRAAAGGDVAYGLAERLVGLLALAVRRVTDRPVPAGSAAAPADRALVGAARAAIAADHPAAGGLMPLAAHLGASPYRLSRAFSREMGISLTRYRNRMRVGRAIDRLEAGDVDGGRLAADLGFADQAHLCRTVREHVGHTPTAVRRLFAQAEGGL